MNSWSKYSILILLSVPLVVGSLELLQIIINEGFSADIFNYLLIILPLGLPILSYKYLIKNNQIVNINNFNIGRFLIAIYVLSDIIIKITVSGSAVEYLKNLILPRGQKAWQVDLSNINTGSFDITQYAGLLLPSICIIYIAYSFSNKKLILIDYILMSIILIITFTDYSRMQFLVGAIMIMSYIKKLKIVFVSLLFILFFAIVQGTIRGDIEGVIESGPSIENIQLTDKSYLGWPELLQNANLIGGVVNDDKIIDLAFTYYLPRFICSNKPIPHETDWGDLKNLWTAAGLYVELALIFGILPAILLYLAFYSFIYLALIKMAKNINMYLYLYLSLAVVLLWAPRSFQSFIQYSPIILVSYIFGLVTTYNNKNNRSYE